MNTISSLLKWIGNLVGANPSTLTTTSKTLVGAINEVDAEVDDAKNALAWKLQGTVVGNTAIAMPSDYNEVLVVAQNGMNAVSATHPKADISNADLVERLGGYYANAGYLSASISLNVSEAKLVNFSQIGSGDATATTTFKLYYR